MEQTENLGGGQVPPAHPPPPQVPTPMDMEVTSQEWVMKIWHLFVYGPINKYYSFVDGSYYKTKSRGGEL